MANTYHKPTQITDPLVTTQAPVEQEAAPIATPAPTGEKLVIYRGGKINDPGDYTGQIVNGKAEGAGTVTWREQGTTWKGNFHNNYPTGTGTLTGTDPTTGKVSTITTYEHGQK